MTSFERDTDTRGESSDSNEASLMEMNAFKLLLTILLPHKHTLQIIRI